MLGDDFLVESVPAQIGNLVETVKRFRPRVIVIDLDPDEHGLRLKSSTAVIRPTPEALFLTTYIPDPTRLNCVSRNGSPQQLIAAIREAGRKAEASLSSMLPYGRSLAGFIGTETAHLSLREQQVLREISLGKRMKEVANSLGISPRTVAFHKYRAMRANGLRNNYELLQFCIRMGLLSTKENSAE